MEKEVAPIMAKALLSHLDSCRLWSFHFHDMPDLTKREFQNDIVISWIIEQLLFLQHWEMAGFPFLVIPKLGALCIAGGTIKVMVALASPSLELLSPQQMPVVQPYILVHSSLAMLTIGFTEPDYDTCALKTTATEVEGGWILEGQKRWIGNSTFADLLMIFARNTSTNQINRFIVKKDAPGLNKIGLRIVQNGDIVMRKVFVLDSDRLPGVNSF